MGVDAPNQPQRADAPVPIVPEPTRGRRWRNRLPLLIVLVLTLFGVAGVVSASFAPTTEEPLDARSHTTVQHACDATYRALKALPPLTHDSTRAELAARTTEENSLFTTMASEFDRVQPKDNDGRVALRAYTADWRSVITRRAQYVRQLGATKKHVDLVIPIDDKGAPVTDRMNQYARTHDLRQCLT